MKLTRFELLTICLLGVLLTKSVTAGDDKTAEIRLVLQITVDGLRADLLNRYHSGFGKDGFLYLINKSAVYDNAHYQHADTETIVGHATLATGAFPSQHGITGKAF